MRHLSMRELRTLLERVNGNRGHPLYVAELDARNIARGDKLRRRLTRKVALGMAGAF